MTATEQWDHGYARGITDAHQLSPVELDKAVAVCRRLATVYPNAAGYVAGVLAAELLAGLERIQSNRKRR